MSEAQAAEEAEVAEAEAAEAEAAAGFGAGAGAGGGGTGFLTGRSGRGGRVPAATSLSPADSASAGQPLRASAQAKTVARLMPRVRTRE